MRDTLATYYKLTKPGIIYGNSLATIGGFLLASQGNVDAGLFLATFFGISLVIAAACVYNNVLDRKIDKAMSRTKKRALPAGKVSVPIALIYGTLLGVGGFTLLVLFTNALATTVALIGLLFYVVVYGIAKRRTVHGTLIGTISGATPPVVGYVAVTSSLDTGALLLFMVLVFWQMPHFYAIALYRKKDYEAANIPVLPRVYGTRATVTQMVAYMSLFIIAVAQLTATGYTGYTYLIIMLVAGLLWLRLGLKGFLTPDKDIEKWAVKVFVRSLHMLMLFCVLISIDTWLP